MGDSPWSFVTESAYRTVLLGLALCGIVAVSYYPALSAEFVWDDSIFVGESAVRAWSGLWTIWFSPGEMMEEHYWPVLYTTFWLEHKLWGTWPFGYHLVNLLLYMANVVLLWHLLRRLSVPGAWAVAAVFAVHPVHVESVAWVIGRKDLLSGLFYVAAALCWIRSIDGLEDRQRRPSDFMGVVRPGLYLASLGLFVAAVLSKSVAVTLPVAFAILLWWKNGRVTWTDAWRIAPFFVVALAVALADLTFYTAGRDFGIDHGPVERVLIAAQALWFYAGKLAWPTDLAVIYPMWDIGIGDPLAWSCLIAAVAVATLLWFGRHRLGRGPLAGVAFFAVTLSPALGFVDHLYMQFSLVADRFAYLAVIGIIAVLVGAAVHYAEKLPDVPKTVALGVLVAVLAVFGKLTWDQSGVYRDEIAFFNHVISLNPEARSAHRNLANALIAKGRPTEALDASSIAVEKRPDSATVHVTRGIALLAVGRLDEATDSLRHALRLDPTNKIAHYNMAEIRKAQGRFEESLVSYREVLKLDPEFAAALAGMGEALFRLGGYGEAVQSLEQATSLRVDALPVRTYHLLAEALRRQQRYQDAIDAYSNVLEIDPDFDSAHAGIGYALLRLERFAEALASLAWSVSLEPHAPDAPDRHVAMGLALEALGRKDEAANHYVRGLEIDPRNSTALNSLAWLRYRQQRYEEALRHYGTLVEIGDANAQIRVNMAAALHYLGRSEEALRSLEIAISLDPALAETGLGEMRDALRDEL